MSKKPKVRYVCGDCGEDFPQWFGRCPSCQAWNTLREFRPAAETDSGRVSSGSLLGKGKGPRPRGFFAAQAAEGRAETKKGLLGTRAPGAATASPPLPVVTPESRPPGAPTPGMDSPQAQPEKPPRAEPRATETGPPETRAPQSASDTRILNEPSPESRTRPAAAHPGRTLVRLGEVPASSVPRLRTGIHELDRILGGGLVPGSVVLIGGDPGIGKSTLLLQAAGRLVARGVRTLYVSGEESAGQIRLRADRLRDLPPDLLLHTETNLEEVGQAVEEIDPEVLVVDSIQTAFLPGVASAPGSVSQVREAALALTALAKSRGISVLLVGHVTKDGAIAGPKTLEHMVDAVLYMEGERYQHYRILRSVKNRFGGIDELGVFEMAAHGLVEVPNPSQVFLSEHTAGAVGSVVSAAVEGTRSLLLEVQALVVTTQYANPQRVSTGYDRRRLDILLAVLDKRTQLEVSKRDVFVNIAGGLRVVEPGVDLGVLLAVASSTLDASPRPDLVACGEVGLGGEIRRIAHPERRIQEIGRLGYSRVLLPHANAKELGGERDGVQLVGVRSVAEAIDFGLNS